MTAGKQKRRSAKAALRKLRLQRGYRILDSLQAPFATVFWMLEQAKAQIDTELERLAT